jgi:hypothetical protein
MNFPRSAFLASLIALLTLVACVGTVTPEAQYVTDTQGKHLEDVKATLTVSPSPVRFGEVPIGTIKYVTLRLELSREIGNDEYLKIESRDRVGLDPVVELGAEFKIICRDEKFGKPGYLSCEFRVGFTRYSAEEGSSGVGTIKLKAKLFTNINRVHLGDFPIDVPYEWGAPAQTTVPETVPINTTVTTTAKVNTTRTTIATVNTLNPLPDPSTAVSSTAAPTTVPVSTPAATPAISISPSEYDFGSVPYRSAARDFVVTNTGSGTLRFTSFRFALGDQFFYTSRNSCQGAELAAGQSCTVSIEVSSGGPDISPPPGDHADTMNIVSNGGNASISLSYTTPG